MGKRGSPARPAPLLAMPGLHGPPQSALQKARNALTSPPLPFCNPTGAAMNGKVGFDNEKYIEEQSTEILERVGRTHNRLYLEFGGKLLYDYHAARVLPGYDPNVKLRLLQHLKDKVDLLLCIFAGDIERKKIRADSASPTTPTP